MFEQAGAIAALIDLYGMTQEQIAAHLSASQSYVANKLRLLRLARGEGDGSLGASVGAACPRAAAHKRPRAARINTGSYNRKSTQREPDRGLHRSQARTCFASGGTAENNGTAILLKSTSSGSRTISKCTSTADSTDDTASSNIRRRCIGRL